MEARKKPYIGFANSMFQASGEVCGKSNWTEAANKRTVPKAEMPISHWDNFEDDLDLMKKIGMTTYRISIEWSHIEPQKNHYDQTVLDRYKKLINACLERDIKPMITLYHFNEPLWFTKLGGFEKEENIKDFISYCKIVFQIFSPLVSLWCTINEPAVQAFSGYLLGQFPPHKHSLHMTVTVLKNLLKAHVDVYHALKELPKSNDAMIGIVHNVLRFKSRYVDLDRITPSLCSRLNNITNNLVIKFFKTGKFEYSAGWGWLANILYHDNRATGANDFIGLNFYANAVIGPNWKNIYGPTCFPGQKMGDMFLPLDAEGFSAAIDEVASLNKPVYITEMGVADQTDKLRQEFLKLYFDVINKKLDKGVDIQGCYLWTFSDNYEWNEGTNKRLFGFFDKDRNPRESVKTLSEMISPNVLNI